MAKQPLYQGPHSFKKEDAMKIYNIIKNKQESMQFYMGRICFFFVEGNKYKNETSEDGFICGVTNDYELVPEDVKHQLIASIFYKEKGNKEYTYLGDVNNIARYDNERNIMLWG